MIMKNNRKDMITIKCTQNSAFILISIWNAMLDVLLCFDDPHKMEQIIMKHSLHEHIYDEC